MKALTKAFLTFIIIIVVSFGLLFLAYKNNSFPSFNIFVDNLIGKTQTNQNEPTTEIESESEKTATIPLKTLPLINNYKLNVFETAENQTSSNLEDYSIPQILFSTTNDDYSIVITGDYNFTLDFEFPIVSKPFVFGDSICIITADNILNVINLQNQIVNERFILNFIVEYDKNLTEPVFVTENAIFVQAINGTKFKIEFEKFAKPGKNLTQTTGNSIKKLFLPDEATEKFMISQINTWGFETKIEKLPTLEFFTGSSLMPLNDLNVHLYVYSPDFASRYDVALTNEKSMPIRGNAIVAVFSERGELMSVSLDYVADRPLVSATLSETEFYYIVAGWAYVDKNNFTTTYVSVSESLEN